MSTWRLLDTGLRPAAENMAMNRAILEAHQAGEAPPTLRFLRFSPCALVGFHQSVAQELDVAFCREQGIAIQRRMTGGGAIYFDETQLGWELYFDRHWLGAAEMESVARRVCEAAAAGISKLGVDARFRPRNDIEVDGRKLSGTGGAFDGDAILYQGTLLLDFDVERMFRVLRIPAEKLSNKAIESARDRVVNLSTLLGQVPTLSTVHQAMAEGFSEAFGMTFEPSEQLNAREQERFAEALAEIDSDEWVYQRNAPVNERDVLTALHKSEGGLIRASLRLDTAGRHVRQLWFTGDFFVQPRRLINDLEAYLKERRIDELAQHVDAFFASYGAHDLLQLRPEDFQRALAGALAQRAE